MAACCILAAIILAQISATLRRWGVFWGVIRPDAYDDPDTLLRRLKSWLARPGVRAIAGGMLMLEVSGFSYWVYAYHGEHLYHLADEAVAGLGGKEVIYARLCNGTKSAGDQRIIVPRDRLPLK